MNMKKRTKFLIILITIILVIGLIIGIKTFRGILILQNIFKEVEENIEKDNYYLKTTYKFQGEETITHVYYRNGIGRHVAGNGLYTWVDGEEAYLVDEENKQMYLLDLEQSIGLVSSDMFAYLIPGYSENLFGRILIAGNVKNKITTEEFDGEKCYVIKVAEEKNIKTVWINAKTNKPVKAVLEFPNGDKCEYIYELSFTATKLTSIELPDKSEYTIRDNETGEEIQQTDKTSQMQNEVITITDSIASDEYSEKQSKKQSTNIVESNLN